MSGMLIAVMMICEPDRGGMSSMITRVLVWSVCKSVGFSWVRMEHNAAVSEPLGKFLTWSHRSNRVRADKPAMINPSSFLSNAFGTVGGGCVRVCMCVCRGGVGG